jgi:L-asparaginase II
VIRLRPGVELVDVERSGVIESVHRGSVALIAADGSVRSLGDTDQPIFPRSSNKPLQAVGMVRAGLDGPSPWIALAAASHSGEAIHVQVVTEMLESVGLDESALQCPLDWPLGDAAKLAAVEPRRITMNCSGKHAAMLLTCRANGWPIDTYLDVDHPLQQAMYATVGSEAGEAVAATGIDGCGAPLFAISLLGLARAFARLAGATDGPERVVADAMRAHPELVGGDGRSVTTLMRSVPGLVAKDGAEGVYAAALPDGRAVAFKIDDGAQRAIDPMIVAGLQALDVDVSLPDAVVLGGGSPVGSVRVRAGVFSQSG